MNLPPEFISNVQNTFREDGFAFLEALPESIAEASAKWDLVNVQPAPTLSYNFVAFAERASAQIIGRGDLAATHVVLKMSVPNREFVSEMEALRLFNGEGACKLLEYDEEKYWMLLERLHPGEMLATLKDDDEATHIAAEVMKKIWRPVVTPPKGHQGDVSDSEESVRQQERFPGCQERSLRMTDSDKFIKLSDWFEGLKRLRKRFNGGTGPLNEKVVERVEGLVSDLLAENHNPVLMHGDFHHYNILSSERGWLIIDPKGVIGPACYEVGPLLTNPWTELINASNLRQITKRRIDILHEHLGFERERIYEWGLAHVVLSTWWSIDDNTAWEYGAAFTAMMADLQL